LRLADPGRNLAIWGMKCLSSVILGLLLSLASALADYEGDASDWKGFVRFDFKLGDRQCILVTPKQAAEG
jgi:hypothetical protein